MRAKRGRKTPETLSVLLSIIDCSAIADIIQNLGKLYVQKIYVRFKKIEKKLIHIDSIAP